jgi:hypothetical protein
LIVDLPIMDLVSKISSSCVSYICVYNFLFLLLNLGSVVIPEAPPAPIETQLKIMSVNLVFEGSAVRVLIEQVIEVDD